MKELNNATEEIEVMIEELEEREEMKDCFIQNN